MVTVGAVMVTVLGMFKETVPVWDAPHEVPEALHTTIPLTPVGAAARGTATYAAPLRDTNKPSDAKQ